MCSWGKFWTKNTKDQNITVTYEETGAKPGCCEQKQGTVHIPFTPIPPEPPLWPKPWTHPYPYLI